MSLLMYTLILIDWGSTFIASSILNYFLGSPVSKYSDIENCDLKHEFLKDTFSP